jgi:hypothetical protein
MLIPILERLYFIQINVKNILFACFLRHYLLQYTDFAAITFREGSMGIQLRLQDLLFSAKLHHILALEQHTFSNGGIMREDL